MTAPNATACPDCGKLNCRNLTHVTPVAATVEQVKAHWRREVRAAAAAVVDATTERDRVLLTAKEAGLSYREIAEAANTVPSWVYSLVRRAKVGCP